MMTSQPPLPPTQPQPGWQGQPGAVPPGWTPPKRSHKIRNGAIALVVVLVVLAAIGSTAKTPAAGSGSPSTAPTALAAATPSPTPDLTGQVVFGVGSAVDASGMTVDPAVTSAKVSAQIGWVAYLSDRAGGTSLELTVARVSAGGAETPVDKVTLDVSNPDSNELGHASDDALGSVATTPGNYTVRYIRPSDGKVLAEGTISLTK